MNTMTFIKQTTGLGEILAAAINEALKLNETVIWLVPGGSNVPISAKASQLIGRSLRKKLVILQTDERFVGATSPDCNWRQLEKAGFVTHDAKAYPMLTNDSLDIKQVANRYQKIVANEFSRANFIIGQFGIGSNGHIAGIMPSSIAAKSKDLVAGYQAEDFARVTLTFAALSQLNQAIAFVYGESKLPALKNLNRGELPLEALPSGILNRITNSAIYNDQIESEEQK